MGEGCMQQISEQGRAEIIREVKAGVFTTQVFFNRLNEQGDQLHLDKNGHCFNFYRDFLQDGGQKAVVDTTRLFLRLLL
jgi:hypothetical protein